MKLYVVTDLGRWGHPIHVVRAASVRDVIRVVKGTVHIAEPGAGSFVFGAANMDLGVTEDAELCKRWQLEIEELGDGPGVLWTHDVSPDLPRD